MPNETHGRVAVIAGAGPGNGAALARRFADAGYRIALLSRDASHLSPLTAAIAGSLAITCDVSDRAAVAAAFDRVREALGPVDALLYNAGSGSFADVQSITFEQFEQAWRINAFGALLCARQVMPDMTQRGAGDIIFIGATASRRGGRNSAAFAPAKAAQRSLAESMARHLWPKGIHVALIVIDGIVDLPRTRAAMPDRADDSFVDPAGVAEIAYQLTCQCRRAWTFECEARPFTENW